MSERVSDAAYLPSSVRSPWRSLAWVTLAVILGGCLGAVAAALTPSSMYSSTATLLVGEHTATKTVEALDADTQRAITLAQLLRSGSSLTRIRESLELDVPLSRLSERVSAYALLGEPFVTITATAPTAAESVALANAVSDLAVNEPVQVPVRVVEPAAPDVSPDSPDLVRYVVSGAIVMLAAALAFVFGSRSGSDARRSAKSELALPHVMPGAILIVAIVAAIALDLPDLAIRALALAAVILAIASPPAGFLILIATFPLPEHESLAPVGLTLFLVAALCLGTGLRVVAARRLPQLDRSTILLIGFAILGLAAAMFVVTVHGGERAEAAVARALDVAAGAAVIAAGGIVLRGLDPRPYLGTLVVATAVVGLLCVWQAAGSGPIGPLSSEALLATSALPSADRVSGPFTNPNYAGMFLTAGAVVAFGISRMGAAMRLVAVPALVPILGGLILTFSRGAIVALAVGVLVSLLISNRRAAMATAAAILVGFLGGVSVDRGMRQELTADGGSTASAAQASVESDASRLRALLSAIPLIQEQPVFGIGIGQFPYESPRYLESLEVTYPHNEYLATLAEHGVVGAALLAAASLALALSLRRARPAYAAIGLGVLAAYAAGSLFLEPLGSFQVAGTLWLTLAVVLAADREVANLVPVRQPADLAHLTLRPVTD